MQTPFPLSVFSSELAVFGSFFWAAVVSLPSSHETCAPSAFGPFSWAGAEVWLFLFEQNHPETIRKQSFIFLIHCFAFHSLACLTTFAPSLSLVWGQGGARVWKLCLYNTYNLLIRCTKHRKLLNSSVTKAFVKENFPHLEPGISRQSKSK